MSQEPPLADREGCKVRLAFYQPDIPQNLGAAIRTAACLSTPLDVIGPCAFPLTDRALRRAALDYGAAAEVTHWDGWEAFRSGRPPGRLVLFTTKGEGELGAFRFAEGDILLFGRESAGAPEAVHAAADARVRIAIAAGARSLNVASAAAIALWEARRQASGRAGEASVP